MVLALYAGLQLVYNVIGWFLSPETQGKFQLKKILLFVSWQTWLIWLLVVLMLILIQGAFRAIRKREDEHKQAIAEVENQLHSVQAELEAAKAEIEESQRNKLIFEVDQRNSRVRVEQTKSAIRIWLNLQLRFENKGIHPLSVKRFDISLHRMGIVDVRDHEDIFTLFAILRVSSNGVRLNKDALEGLTIAGHELSPFYLIETMIAVEDEHIKTAEDLDAVTYLRVAMQSSGNQPEVTAELHAHWKGALGDEGTSLILVTGAPYIPKDYRRLD